jgi:hypothetical protein
MSKNRLERGTVLRDLGSERERGILSSAPRHSDLIPELEKGGLGHKGIRRRERTRVWETD